MINPEGTSELCIEMAHTSMVPTAIALPFPSQLGPMGSQRLPCHQPTENTEPDLYMGSHKVQTSQETGWLYHYSPLPEKGKPPHSRICSAPGFPLHLEVEIASA